MSVRSKDRLGALVACVVALSAGCLLEANPPAGGVEIYWTFSSATLPEIGDLRTDGATAICAQAAVHDVRITLWRSDPAGAVLQPSTNPCVGPHDVPGAAFGDLEPGRWGYYLEARRGGARVFEASGDFEIVDGERTPVDVRAAPVAGNWDVAVDYTTSGCAAGDRVKFDLLDTDGTARVVFSTDDTGVNPEVVVPCEHTLPFTIPSVAPGNYQLSDWVHVDATGTVEKAWSTCRPSWTQTDTGNAGVSVDVTSGVCL